MLTIIITITSTSLIKTILSVIIIVATTTVILIAIMLMIKNGNISGIRRLKASIVRIIRMPRVEGHSANPM